MKKLGLLLMVVLAATIILGRSSQKGEIADELLVSNIEALADHENVQYGYCYGSGEVDCPDGTKAAYVMGKYNLD